jgi:TolB-like protein/class 3 adenylate cyclase
MESEPLPRKLAAILYADVAGYSRLTGEDEDTTHRRLAEYLDQMAVTIERHRGRVMHYAGDAVLAMFEAVVDALSCAAHIQNDLKTRNDDLPDERKVQFRIGVNLGDVIEDRDDIYGDGVNVAARLESLAEPGGICISESVHTAVGTKLPFDYEFLGEQEVKNIAKPVKAYHGRLTPGAALPEPTGVSRKAKQMHRPIVVAAVVLLVALGGVLTWLSPWEPQEEPASIERMAFPLPDKPSIAVLPFTNMSDDPKQEYFVDGMTEDLITDLSKLTSLFVSARNSTFTYKGKAVKVRQVAEELGVRYVLEGSVRLAGSQIRINAQLVDATTGGHVWADRYDSPLDDVFALQDNVTRSIVTALAVNLTAVEQDRQSQKGTDSPEAYDSFLRAWSHYLLHTPEDFAKAISYLENAIKLDPGYGRAHAALAAIYLAGWNAYWAKSFGMSNNEAYEKMKRHLEEALKQPTPLAHRVAAKIYTTGGRWNEAMAESERAIALDANDPNGYVAMGTLLVKVGSPSEGLEFIETAMRLDPRSDYLYRLGDAQFHLERFEEAAATLLRATKRNPGDEWNFFLLAAAYGQLGREQEASSAIEMFNNLRLKARQRQYTLTDIDNWNFKEAAERERLRNGLRKAGLPEGRAVPQRKSLTSAVLRSLFPGNTATGETVFGDGGHVYHVPDGKLLVRTFSGQTDQGTWEITKDGQFCRQWNNFDGGRKTCFIYFTKGNEYEFWDADGSRMFGKFKLRLGNPENL